MSEIMDHTAPNRSEARSPDGSEPSAGVITEERVAAAFEAWAKDSNGRCGPWIVSLLKESTPDYANRLAAGLFKYLERVT